MTEADLILTYPLGEVVHADHPESPAVQPNRLALFPRGCLVLEDPTGRGDLRVQGYCVSHPGVVGRPQALDSVLNHLPDGADCLYIHDVCLRPLARGRGFMAPLMAHLRETARAMGFSHLALTAVSGAEAVWSRLGFQYYVGDSILHAKLATYGGPAYHMVLDLAPSDQ